MKLSGLIHQWVSGDEVELFIRVRVGGIRAPKREGEQREHGDLSLAFAESLAPPGSPATVDVTGRRIRLVLLDGTDFAAAMLQCGHAGPASEEA